MSAAPKLRLSTAAVGPVPVAVGANAPSQTVEATNAGDGALNLNFASSVPWMSATTGSSANCKTAPGCTPIVIALNTSSLAKGVYTAVLTVSDPNAIDAPQTITVTVDPGGTVPDRIDFYAAPAGNPDDYRFTSASNLSFNVTTQSGGPFLSVALEGAGSFSFTYPWRIRATPQPDMAEGNYNGSIAVSGSSLAAENKTVPVTLHVTSQPIATLSQQNAVLRVAQGGPKQTANIVISNRGLGTLSVSGATATTASGGNWLSAANGSGFTGVTITADPASLSPGAYQGTVSVTSNAAQGTLTIPVELDVLTSGPPTITYGGVVNNGVFTANDTFAPGSIVSAFGDQFTTGAPQVGSVPLPNTLGGTQAFINDKPAPLFYSSYGLVNLEIPYDAAPGDAVLRIDRDGQRGNSISITIAASAPRILKYGDYAIAVNPDGTLAVPASLGGRPANRGDVIVVYATGFGQTTPAVNTGEAAPSSPLAQVVPTPNVVFGTGPFGSSIATPAFVGLTPGLTGLYQINVAIPTDAPTGDNVTVSFATDQVESNVAKISIAPTP